MPSSLIKLDISHIDKIVNYAMEIYNNADPDKYPDFKISADIDSDVKFKKFFSIFLLPCEFTNYNIRQAYALVNEAGEYEALVGVKRHDFLPSWSVSWLLSPKTGVKFIPTFRTIMEQLCVIHEAAGMNEFFVTYPTLREEAYSRIMLPFREKYYSFVEATIPAKTCSPYILIHDLMGQTLIPHDINLRRYILRRAGTEPASEGGIATRKSKDQ